MFRDRSEAGTLLGDKLRDRYFTAPVVLALMRGGLPVAQEVAKALQAPMDILLVRKICLPGRSEVTVGAICEGGGPIFNHPLLRGLELTPDLLEPLVTQKRKEIAALRKESPLRKEPLDLRDKDVIIVDDSISSGMTALMAIKGARLRGAASVLMAAPIVEKHAIGKIADAKVETVALQFAEHLYMLKNFFERGSQTYTQNAHHE